MYQHLFYFLIFWHFPLRFRVFHTLKTHFSTAPMPNCSQVKQNMPSKLHSSIPTHRRNLPPNQPFNSPSHAPSLSYNHFIFSSSQQLNSSRPLSTLCKSSPLTNLPVFHLSLISVSLQILLFPALLPLDVWSPALNRAWQDLTLRIAPTVWHTYVLWRC